MIMMMGSKARPNAQVYPIVGDYTFALKKANCFCGACTCGVTRCPRQNVDCLLPSNWSAALVYCCVRKVSQSASPWVFFR